MHAAAAAAQLYRMFQVQHFVVDDVFHCGSRNAEVVENSADDDGVVRGIVVAEAAAGFIAAPCHTWPRQQPVKKSGIQIVENDFQIVDLPLRRFDSFPSAELPQQVHFFCNGMTGDISPVSG